MRAIIAELERIDALLLTNRAETICDEAGIKIIKTEFKVAKTKESARSSGNRCIVAWHRKEQFVAILLVYSKTDLEGDNETKEWKRMVRENYEEYEGMV